MTSKPVEIPFKQADGLDIYMDVFLSPTASAENPAPILLWWHGGGLLQASIYVDITVRSNVNYDRVLEKVRY